MKLNLQQFDFNLFLVFDVLMCECNLLCVVICLYCSQLVVSNVFVCLCEQFDQLLFWCIVKGLEFIVVVFVLYVLVCQVLYLLQVGFGFQEIFDLYIVWIFCLMMNDYVQLCLLLGLVICLKILVLWVMLEVCFDEGVLILV